jgi:hypothetical protein
MPNYFIYFDEISEQLTASIFKADERGRIGEEAITSPSPMGFILLVSFYTKTEALFFFETSVNLYKYLPRHSLEIVFFAHYTAMQVNLTLHLIS